MPAARPFDTLEDKRDCTWAQGLTSSKEINLKLPSTASVPLLNASLYTPPIAEAAPAPEPVAPSVEEAAPAPEPVAPECPEEAAPAFVEAPAPEFEEPQFAQAEAVPEPVQEPVQEVVMKECR